MSTNVKIIIYYVNMLINFYHIGFLGDIVLFILKYICIIPTKSALLKRKYIVNHFDVSGILL